MTRLAFTIMFILFCTSLNQIAGCAWIPVVRDEDKDEKMRQQRQLDEQIRQQEQRRQLYVQKLLRLIDRESAAGKHALSSKQLKLALRHFENCRTAFRKIERFGWFGGTPTSRGERPMRSRSKRLIHEQLRARRMVLDSLFNLLATMAAIGQDAKAIHLAFRLPHSVRMRYFKSSSVNELLTILQSKVAPHRYRGSWVVWGGEVRRVRHNASRDEMVAVVTPFKNESVQQGFDVQRYWDSNWRTYRNHVVPRYVEVKRYSGSEEFIVRVKGYDAKLFAGVVATFTGKLVFEEDRPILSKGGVVAYGTQHPQHTKIR